MPIHARLFLKQWLDAKLATCSYYAALRAQGRTAADCCTAMLTSAELQAVHATDLRILPPLLTPLLESAGQLSPQTATHATPPSPMLLSSLRVTTRFYIKSTASVNMTVHPLVACKLALG